MLIGLFVALLSACDDREPVDVKNLAFGTVFTDNMFVMKWSESQGWHDARIEPYHAFSFDPSSLHLHYGSEIFEGMKAFRTAEDHFVLFRPQEHLQRMNRSAKRMMMPEIDTHFVEAELKKLVSADSRWVPKDPGTSLYIRPTMVATQKTINLVVSNEYLFYIIMSPVGSFYKNGQKPTSILVSDTYTRSSVGGVGDVKTGGNYAASMMAQHDAKKQGYDQVLWLDPVERRYVEEVGSMNIFFVMGDEIVTPELTGTILPGITRKSVLEYGRAQGWKMTERRISIDEVVQSIENGTCTEIFGTGTAAVISSVGKLRYKGKDFIVADIAHSYTQKVYDAITGIQQGRVTDEWGWLSHI
jgi:branched-chain amino acid aminotransferase